MPHEVGKANGLTDLDSCKTKDANREFEKTFFAAPTQSVKDASAEVREKERQFKEQHAGKSPFMTPGNNNSSSPSRKTPNEKELDRLEREAAANPRVAAMKCKQQNNTI